MRVLFVIPHFYKGVEENTRYSSYSKLAKGSRLQVLDTLIFKLHSLFGQEHYGAQHHKMSMEKLPNSFGFDFDIKICTTGDSHLINELECPQNYYEHIPSNVEPLLLGFRCHNVMKEHAGQYDYYCYMEDDILIHDQFFFKKLEFFNKGPNYRFLLQPQRYDSCIYNGKLQNKFLTKVYPDYETQDTPKDGPGAYLQFLGMDVKLIRTSHPHAGCFFLTNEQFLYLAEKPEFGNTRGVNMHMALDLAASQAIARNFEIFKPAYNFMNFFEVEHGNVNMIKQVSLDENNNVRWYWDSQHFDPVQLISQK